MTRIITSFKKLDVSMLWNITISCVEGAYLEKIAKKQCEIDSSFTLEDLCDFILEIFGFDRDHMHHFFISRSSRAAYSDDKLDEEMPLDDIYPLERNQYLHMIFDYGDNWIFKITRSNTKVLFNKKHEYPRVVQHIGKNPEQYPMYEGCG